MFERNLNFVITIHNKLLNLRAKQVSDLINRTYFNEMMHLNSQ